MKILFFGDVYAAPGRTLIAEKAKALKEEFSVDLLIANGENLAGGKGLTEKTAGELFRADIDVLTGGNHLWAKAPGLDYIKRDRRVLKPLNYPAEAYGNTVFQCSIRDVDIAVLCMTGQGLMPNADSPLHCLERELLKIKAKIILIDFHAEYTGEKRAMGFYFDGKVSAFIGTHTHVQTADEEILPKGTAYITDVGMTGAHDSVIGVKKEIILHTMKTGMPLMYKPAKTGLQVNAVLISFDQHTGRAVSIERIKRSYS
ncbi:MAG: TIGR00282 family metallophosphoesterase [Candidatus Cloacimonetes bacterium]|nr:TIGR00282 family metallophosphoesterase [Candidatus Cloacimonadota bacterium]